MNAQQAWKSEYQRFKKEMAYGWPSTAWQIINYARRYVREAALERKLDAANRRIAELEEKIMILESDSINEYMSADTLKDLDDMKIAERLAKIQQAEIDLVNTWHEHAR